MSVFRNLLMKVSGWLGKPADWSDIRKDCPANSIALYAGHPADFSQYDNLGFTATCIGGYNVFIDGEQYGSTYASGTQCNITWSTSGITTGDDITTPSALKAHKIWIEPATEGNNITAFKCQRVAASGYEEQGVLWAHFNLTNTINLNTGLADDYSHHNNLMKACTAKNNVIKISGLNSCFHNMQKLEYVPTFDGDNNIVDLYASFYLCLSLEKINFKNTRFRIGANTFNNAQALKKLPKLDYSSATEMQDFLSTNTSLEDTILDVSAATGLKVIRCRGWSGDFMSGFKGLRISNEAPFSESAPQINVSYTGMDRQALVTLFNDLPTVSSGQIINITGCTGSEDLLPEDIDIATNKGWTVTGGPEFRTYFAYTNNNDASVYTLDNPINGPVFNQPNLTENGTMGGDTCAVESDVAQYPDETVAVYKGFDGNTGTLFHSLNTAVGYFTYYSPNPICVTKITFTNQGTGNSRASASGTIYGSNDNTNWTTITTYTNSSTSAVWDIDLSSNTNYYKYYKLYSDGAVGGGSFWVFKECKFTATQQPSNLYNSSLQLLSPQPAFDANKQGLNGLLTGSLTNNDGIYSGFNSANYLSCDNFLNNTQSSFEVKSAVNLTSNVGGDCCIVDTVQTDAKTAFRFEITTENKIRCRLSNDTTSSFTYFLTMLSNTVLDLNTWYYVKVTYNSTTGYALYVTQDENNWGEPEVTSAITTMINKTQQELRLGYNVALGSAVPGYIDATKTCFIVDGKNNNLYYLQDSITINNSGVYIDYARNSANDKQGL